MMQPLVRSSVHFLSPNEEILTKKILQTHMPDDRHIDSAALLHLPENILQNITMQTVTTSHREAIQKTKTVSNLKELCGTIHHITCEMLQNCRGNWSLHATTMATLELLQNYSWGTKLVIVLVALAACYGEFWLIAKFYPIHPLASSIANLKGLRKKIKMTESFERPLKALRFLVEKMVAVTRCMVEFEILPAQYITEDYEALAVIKTQIPIASYWVIRSSVACVSQITSLIKVNFKQMSTSAISATWELWSSARKVNSMGDCLRKQFKAFYQQIEKKIHSSLLHLFNEVHDDNQKVLRTLFALKDDFPLRDCPSQRKVGISELRNMEVVLFISSLDICLEKLLLILQQLQNHPQNGSNKSYGIVWVPITNVIPWSDVEEKAFNRIVDIVPWYSLYEPSRLSSSVIKFIQEVWHFEGDPQMVVLDPKGKVTSLNAIDMVSIWGEKAFPFSLSKDRELWEEQSWTMDFLVDDIDPLLSHWIEDGRIICLYGSTDLNWIQELTNRIRDIIRAGALLELVYVGSNYSKHTREVLSTITNEKLSSFLTYNKNRIFWFRVESMWSSKLRLGSTIESDFIMKEVNALLSFDPENRGWVIISAGSSTEILKLSGDKVLECLSLFQIWGPNVSKVGFLGAIRQVLDPPPIIDSCDYYSIIPYVEDLDCSNLICKKCKSPMEKYFMYQCKRS